MILGAVQPRAAVYRLRPSTTLDSLGDPVESWESPQRTRLPRAECQAVSSEDGTQLLEDERRLYIAGASDVQRDDRLEVDGVVWVVDGEPVVSRGLSAGVITRATLTRLSGRRER